MVGQDITTTLRPEAAVASEKITITCRKIATIVDRRYR
jgi:hypothetical protein